MQGVADPRDVTRDEALIEAQLVRQRGDCVRRRAGAENDFGGIARQHFENAEYDERGEDKRRR